MLTPPPILGPGTVDDLIADARLHQRKATQRMIMDWQQLGLLDYPEAQGGAGKGKGSKKALYSANQRKLFRALIEKRSYFPHVAHLAAIPVWCWMYFGDEYVLLSQTKRALRTWIDRYSKPSRASADNLAAELCQQLDHPEASPTARNRLRRLLGDAIYNATGPTHELQDAMWAVFDPRDEDRFLGAAAAPMSPESVLGPALYRVAAIRGILDDTLTDEDFDAARVGLRDVLQEYLRRQPALAASAGDLGHLYQVPTWDELLQNACSNLLFALGGELEHRLQSDLGRADRKWGKPQ